MKFDLEYRLDPSVNTDEVHGQNTSADSMGKAHLKRVKIGRDQSSLNEFTTINELTQLTEVKSQTMETQAMRRIIKCSRIPSPMLFNKWVGHIDKIVGGETTSINTKLTQ